MGRQGQVYLVRHGETESNRVRRYAGHSAESLTADGKRQIRELAERMKPFEVRNIWSSGVVRAMESAAILCSVLRAPMTVDRRLDEMVMGPWEGLTEAECQEQYREQYAVWSERPDLLRLEGRETLAALAARVTDAVRQAARHEDLAVVVTHVAPIRVALLDAIQAPLRLYRRVCVENADCFRINYETRQVARLRVDGLVTYDMSELVSN